MKNFIKWTYGSRSTDAPEWIATLVTIMAVIFMFAWIALMLYLESGVMLLVTIVVPTYLIWDEYQKRDKSGDI